jgi:hypothetical protein
MFNWIVEALYEVRWFFQRLTRGFADNELWCLDITVAKFVLPRLKECRKRLGQNKYAGIPGAIFDEVKDDELATKKWLEIIDKISLAFEITLCEANLCKTLSNSRNCTHTVSDMIKCGELQKEGLDLFAKYFVYLGDD